ncbi:hypothetical protein [Nannocystis pusilla]|uniref:Cytochrome c domain-containing protein n=1 Tax=Nannocystis pusilla TaxID=889268 RepID=A0ABS7TUL6_9BACT|nr:hypothetical protein [Nannocystis pusilla]MBZ5711918.1 hypothetical protein [Nannocystis pusilla]
MIRLPLIRMARLVLPGVALVACVYDGSGVSAGAGMATTAAETTATIVAPTTGTADATGDATSSSTGEPQTTGPGTTTGAVEPEPSTGTTTSGTTTGGTTDEDDDEHALDFESDIQPIFSDYCTCHGDGDPSPDLGVGRAYESIVRERADDVKSMALVEPGQPDESYLWHKIAGTHDEVGGKGKRMPPSDLLLDRDLDLIEAWIAQGAPP